MYCNAQLRSGHQANTNNRQDLLWGSTERGTGRRSGGEPSSAADNTMPQLWAVPQTSRWLKENSGALLRGKKEQEGHKEPLQGEIQGGSATCVGSSGRSEGRRKEGASWQFRGSETARQGRQMGEQVPNLPSSNSAERSCHQTLKGSHQSCSKAHLWAELWLFLPASIPANCLAQSSCAGRWAGDRPALS